MKQKVIQKSDCAIGWFTTIGVNHKGTNHIIYRRKPLCNCSVNKLADLDIVSFNMDISKVECNNCKRMWDKNAKKRWQKF